MEYISHEDYKGMMENFKTGAPKGLLKEDLEQEGNAFTAGLAKAKKGEEFKVDGKSVKDTSNYDAPIKEGNATVEAVFSKYSQPLLKALAMRAKNQEDIDAHDAVDEVLRTIAKKLGIDATIPFMEDEMFSGNYSPKEALAHAKEMFAAELEDNDLDEYKFDQMYPEDPGPFEGEVEESHPGMDKWYEDFENGLQNLVKNGYIHKNQYQYFRDALDHVDPMQNYGHMPAHDAAKEFVDDLRTKDQMDADDYQWKQEHGGYDYDGGGDDFNDGEFWEAEAKKLQELAGLKEDIEWDHEDEEEREKRAAKAEEEDVEAENRPADDLDEEEGKPNMHDPHTVAKIVAQKHPELKKMFDEYQVSNEKYKEFSSKPNFVNDPEFREFVKGHNALWKKIENEAISWAGDAMLEAGESKIAVRNLLSGYGYFEDWAPDFLDSLKKELKGVAEGLNMPPLQATGQTIVTNEDQAPYGFSVLSPDERKQLKEFINSYKTIKKEISKLLEKAGKPGKIMEATAAEDEKVPAERPAHYNEPTKTPKHKHSNLGGNRTGLVMTKAEMWENEEHEDSVHEKIEGQLNHKLHDAFHKVTGMIMKDLMDDGFDEGDIKLFLQHEIEEKAKEAVMSQHDF